MNDDTMPLNPAADVSPESSTPAPADVPPESSTPPASLTPTEPDLPSLHPRALKQLQAEERMRDDERSLGSMRENLLGALTDDERAVLVNRWPGPFVHVGQRADGTRRTFRPEPGESPEACRERCAQWVSGKGDA